MLCGLSKLAVQNSPPFPWLLIDISSNLKKLFQRVPTKRGKSSEPATATDGPTPEKKSKTSNDKIVENDTDGDDDGHDSEGEGVEEINDDDE